MKSIIDAVQAHTTTCQKSYQTKLESLRESIESVTGLPPKVDIKGRLHAPETGYYDPVKNHHYHKGQFIPFDGESDDMFFDKCPSRRTLENQVLINKELIDFFKQKPDLDGLDASLSKTFDRYGKPCAFLYITAFSIGYLNALLNAIKLIMDKYSIEEEKLKAIEKANKGDCPKGKTQVVGVIVNVKMTPNHFSNSYDYKMLVKLENGATIYGTVPSKLIPIEQGDKVQFNCTVTPSDDDKTHGYYSRPSKAVKI